MRLMNDTMKIRAQLKNGITEIKVLISHPMETGRRKNDFGEVEPAHFVQTVTATLNGKIVLEAQWGTGISKNPYLTFRLKDAKAGDKIAVKWLDNKGESGTIETAIVAA
jgi:sulfur-oxidizing protein SoxZ